MMSDECFDISFLHEPVVAILVFPRPFGCLTVKGAGNLQNDPWVITLQLKDSLRREHIHGKQIIENLTTLRATFGATAHLQWEWLRMDEDRYGIISADDTRLSDGGFRLMLGPADVDVKVTFRCALITD